MNDVEGVASLNTVCCGGGGGIGNEDDDSGCIACCCCNVRTLDSCIILCLTISALALASADPKVNSVCPGWTCRCCDRSILKNSGVTKVS